MCSFHVNEQDAWVLDGFSQHTVFVRESVCARQCQKKLRTHQRLHCCKELGDQRPLGPSTDFLCDVTAAVILANCVTLVDVHPSSFDDGDSRFQTQSKYDFPYPSTLDELNFRLSRGFHSSRVHCSPRCVTFEDVIILWPVQPIVFSAHGMSLAFSCHLRGQRFPVTLRHRVSSTSPVGGPPWDSAGRFLLGWSSTIFSRCLHRSFGKTVGLVVVPRMQMMTVPRHPTIRTILQFGLCPSFQHSL